MKAPTALLNTPNLNAAIAIQTAKYLGGAEVSPTDGLAAEQSLPPQQRLGNVARYFVDSASYDSSMVPQGAISGPLNSLDAQSFGGLLTTARIGEEHQVEVINALDAALVTLDPSRSLAAMAIRYAFTKADISLGFSMMDRDAELRALVALHAAGHPHAMGLLDRKYAEARRSETQDETLVEALIQAAETAQFRKLEPVLVAQGAQTTDFRNDLMHDLPDSRFTDQHDVLLVSTKNPIDYLHSKLTLRRGSTVPVFKNETVLARARGRLFDFDARGWADYRLAFENHWDRDSFLKAYTVDGGVGTEPLKIAQYGLTLVLRRDY